MRLSRRGLIRGAFGTVLGLPWLEALAGPRVAQRLVLMFNANGTVCVMRRSALDDFRLLASGSTCARSTSPRPASHSDRRRRCP